MFTTKQSYTSINNDSENANNKQEVSTQRNNISFYKKYCISEETCFKIMRTIFVIFVCLILIALCVGLLFLLGMFFEVVGVLYVSMRESIIVYLFGRAVYNKNYAICSHTDYSNPGNGCYTTTSVYCTSYNS